MTAPLGGDPRFAAGLTRSGPVASIRPFVLA